MKTGTYKGNGGYTYTVLDGGDEPLIVVTRPDGSVTRAKADSTAKAAIIKELEGKEPDAPLQEDEPAQPAVEKPAPAPEKGMLEKGKDYISKTISDKMAEMKGLGKVPDGDTFMGLQGDNRSLFEAGGDFRADVVDGLKSALGPEGVKALAKAMASNMPKDEKPAEEKGTKPEVSVDGGSFRAGVDVDGDKKADIIPVARTGR